MDVENPMNSDIPVATLVRLEVVGEPIDEPKTLQICASKICNVIKIIASSILIISAVGGILLYVFWI
jgi:hypothetical protein